MKQIVIVGAGIAGIKIAKILSQNKQAKVLLVEPKEYFEVPFAQLRALLDPEDFSQGIRKPISALLPQVEHIQKKASGVKDKSLVLEDGSQLPFDYFVLATGSYFPSWTFLKSPTATMNTRQKEVQVEGAELEKASSVLIIGGGPVGVELAGEIA
jgi:NADH dehydrogenase FAD-containing subunit